MKQETPNTAQPPGQLEGVRVVDLSRILSGPFCTMHLADLGAEVIKVEPPDGDPIRQQGHSIEGLSWYFAAFNRNKRSIQLNLRSAEGMEALRKLIATADVVVDNFRPGVMDKMGLGWDALQALRPGIIHTSISGFGQSGPYVHRPAFDFIAQGMSGFMTLNPLMPWASNKACRRVRLTSSIPIWMGESGSRFAPATCRAHSLLDLRQLMTA